MFTEDAIFDVVGCLEFDPRLSAPKRHREYLKSFATFHQVSHAATLPEYFWCLLASAWLLVLNITNIFAYRS